MGITVAGVIVAGCTALPLLLAEAAQIVYVARVQTARVFSCSKENTKLQFGAGNR